ncbi:hypothetical protein B2J71_19330, partial [Vibrio cholerae]
VDCSFIERGELEGCDFSYSDLRDASFKNCSLSMSYFKGANCFGIEFRECDLKGAPLRFAPIHLFSNKSHFSIHCLSKLAYERLQPVI